MIERPLYVIKGAWERLDVPGEDHCVLAPNAQGYVLHGRAKFTHPQLVSERLDLEYRIVCNHNFSTFEAEIENRGYEPGVVKFRRESDGDWFLNGKLCPGMKECPMIDLGFTPATNIFQVLSLPAELDPSITMTVAWWDWGEKNLRRLDQVYSPAHTASPSKVKVRYQSIQMPYEEDLTLNHEGFLLDYPGLWRFTVTK